MILESKFNHPSTSPYQPHQPEKSRYDHWMGETTRNISAFLSLGFGSSTVPFHILQADDMFYEEMCLGESYEKRRLAKRTGLFVKGW